VTLRQALILLAALVVLLIIATLAWGGQAIPPQAMQHKALLIREARMVWGLDAPIATFAGQVHQESAWNQDAVSHAGAQGLAQFMPATAKWMPTIAPDTGEPLPFSPSWALRAMVTYDRWLWRRAPAASDCDRWHKTLAAYNGGETRLRREEAMAKAAGMDPGRWGHVALFNAGRSRGNYRENRTYPTRILRKWTELYREAGWGKGGCDVE
jgi:membrane-bound lytic murein transglycosylase MltF